MKNEFETYKKDDFMQVIPPSFDALSEMLDNARGENGFARFAYITNVDERTLTGIYYKEKTVPVKFSVLKKISEHSEGEVPLEAICAANGMILKKVLGEAFNEFLNEGKNEDVYSEKFKKIEQTSKLAVLASALSDKAVRKIGKNQGTLNSDPAFNIILNDFIREYGSQDSINISRLAKYFNQPEVDNIPKRKSDVRNIAKMLEEILADY